LDTVVLLGAVAITKPSPWIFAAGAMIASVVWFSALGFGATRLAPVLSTPRAWRVLDACVAVTMMVLAITLVLTA
jgi:L-lysine exporter family protein LysE/ArgO